jgi:hypothetical protein
MSNQRFIELSSSYRNRNLYPNPSEFALSFTSTNILSRYENVRGICNGNKIFLSSNNSTDTVIKGTIDYLFGNVFDTGSLYFDNGTGIITSTNTATILSSTTNPNVTLTDYFKNITIIVTDTLTNNIVGITTITSSFLDIPPPYINITFSPNLSLLDGYPNYSYTTSIDGGSVIGGTSSTIIVNNLVTVYSNVIDYYIGFQIQLYTLNNPVLATSTIKSYNPSTKTFDLNIALSIIPTSSMYFTITNPTSSIILPGIDLCGKTILDYDQSYHNYFLINETKSNISIISSPILSFNNMTRSIIIESSFVYDLYDIFSIRESLPDQFLTTISSPNYQGLIISQINANTVVVSGLSSTANYNGFEININGYPLNIITSSSLSNTNLVLKDNVTISSFPVNFTINSVFERVNPYPQLTINRNCIFLPSTANQTDNFYNGKYIYIYPNRVANNQTTILQNIKGSCFYIQSYIGNGYNVCYVINVETPDVNSDSIYPTYINTQSSTILPGTQINIVSFLQNNYIPLIYTGSIVSQTQSVAYEISLLQLVLPNLILETGSYTSFYPYVYVEFSVLEQRLSQTIYSNNPNSNRAIFLVPIKDIRNKTLSPFIKLTGGSMAQTVKFKPNDSLRFSVYLPNGKLFKTIPYDYYSPSEPNPFIQINAVFGITRIA